MKHASHRLRQISLRALRDLFLGRDPKRRRPLPSSAVRFESLEGRLLLAGDLDLIGCLPLDASQPQDNQAPSTWTANSSSEDPAEGEDTPAQDLVAFAKALAQTTGVKLYAAAWCPACNSQKALFEDGADYLPFIEVTNPDRSLNAAGTAANITSYPTWQFPDGTRESGVLSLATIAQRSGVAIPNGVNPTMAPIVDQAVLGGSPLHVALNGYDPNGGPLTYTVTSSNPSLVQATVLSGNRSAKVAVEGWGDMVFQLFESDVPGATGRFIALAQAGFYNSANNSTPIKMHRVIDNFMFQFGDPTNTGTSGSTLGTFDDDFDAKLQHNTTGVLSWAKSDDDTNNSQVFVTDTATRWLDFNHSVFGQLIEGDKVRNAINGTAVTGSTPKFDINLSTVSIFNDTENGLLRLVAAEGASGSADITVTVTDSAGHQFVDAFTVSVSPDSTNNLPFLADIPVIRTTVNTPATFTLSGTDLESNAVKFAGLKSGSVNYTFTVNSTTGEVTVTPPAGFIGTMQLLVGVKAATDSSTALTADSSSSSVYDKQLVTIQVGPAAPTAVDLQVASDSGYLNTDNLTRTNSLSFDVLGVTNGAVVKLYRGTTLLGSATATGSTVTITTTGLASLGDGTYNITATQTVSGMESVASTALAVTLDTTAPPIFTSTPPTVAPVGTLLTYNVQNAEEGTTGTVYSLVNAPTGVTLNASTGVLSWTPTAAQFGVHAFSVVLTDGAGNTRTQDLSIQVTSDSLLAIRLDTTNASGVHLSTVDVGTEFLLKAYVEDLRLQPQGVFGAVLDVLFNQQLVTAIGPVTFGSDYTASQQHDIATGGIINETGAYAGSLSPLGGGERLLFSVLVRATKSGTVVFTSDEPDGISAQDPAPEILLYGEDLSVAMDDIHFGTTSLIINPAFVSNNDLFLVNEDSGATSVNPLTNDVQQSGSTGTLTIASVGATNHGGTVVIAADGKSLTYTPAANFFGDETFTYTASDGTGERTAEVTIRAASINDNPTAVADTLTVTEDAVDAQLNVLANDLITPDTGETLQILSVSSLSGNGSITVNAAKTRLVYTPAANFFGTETFAYTISDGHGGTSTVTSSVTTVEANDPPSAQDDLVQANEDSTANSLTVLANDSTQGDANETLTITAVTTPDHGGTVTIASNGQSLIYTPAANYFGTERFQYTINDGNGGTAQASVVVTVVGVNDPPTAVADTLSIVKNTTNHQIDVLANDSSAPDATETLVVSAVGTTSSGGTVTIINNGAKIQYTPATGFTGSETFQYTVRDPSGATSQATVTVTVLDYIPSKMSGYAYIDTNNNGIKESGEAPLGGVVIKLTGTNASGTAVSLQQTTDATGFYQFTNLAPGAYKLTEVQPLYLIDGIDSGGTLGTSTGADQLTVQLPQDTDGQNLNFGERGRKAQHISVFDFFATTPRDSVLVTTTSDGTGQWYAVEGGWSHAKMLQVQYVAAAATANFNVTTTDAQQYSAVLNYRLRDQVQWLAGSGSNQLVRVVATPSVLFPNADCACAEGESTLAATTVADDAEGEASGSTLYVGATAEADVSSTTVPTTLLLSSNDIVAGDNDVVDETVGEGESESEILMAPTPADAYLAADLLMATGESETSPGQSYDALIDDLVDGDEAYVFSVELFFASSLGGELD